MTVEEVRRLFSVLDVRERLIARLARLAGMRPGEIFGLKWARLEADYADIQQRVYRGNVDSPKSVRSVRHAALSDGLVVSIEEWRAVSLDTDADAWVFPSESLTTPLAKDNCWRRSCCQSSGRSVWVGQTSGHATHSQLAAKGARCRSTCAGRADGAHHRCERERLYDHIAQAPQGSRERAGEGDWYLMDSIGL